MSDEELENIWASATRPERAPIELSNAMHIQQMFKTTESILKYIVGRLCGLPGGVQGEGAVR